MGCWNLSKNTSKVELIDAIKVVKSGDNYYPDTISKRLFKLIAPSKVNNTVDKNIHFSEREISIIRLICEQKTTKEIASELYLSIRTIEDYSAEIKHKTGSRNMVGIALYAVKAGIFKIP